MSTSVYVAGLRSNIYVGRMLKKRSWPKSKHFPHNLYGGTEEDQLKTSVRTAGVLVEIQTTYFKNTWQKRHHLNKLAPLRYKIFSLMIGCSWLGLCSTSHCSASIATCYTSAINNMTSREAPIHYRAPWAVSPGDTSVGWSAGMITMIRLADHTSRGAR